MAHGVKKIAAISKPGTLKKRIDDFEQPKHEEINGENKNFFRDGRATNLLNSGPLKMD